MIRNIAVVVSGMDEEYPYNIISGINDFARKYKFNVSYFAAFGGIIDSSEFDQGEFSIFGLPDFSGFDGALLLSNTFANKKTRELIINKVKDAHIPTVIFECKDYEEFYDVSINNYDVMKKLVEHLITVHGARTFNFISGPSTNTEANDRLQAFRDALREHNIEFDERRFFRGLFRSYDGIKAIEQFAEFGLDLPDAFVCANDSMALTAMSKLQHMGYKVPNDVIVTGFDNTFNAQNSYPTLTTVKRPLYESGRKACQVLLDLMNGNEQPRSTLMEAEPVFGQSCGCGLHDFEDIREFKRKTYQRIERTYTSVHMLNRLIAGLAGAQNMEECVAAIEQMVRTLEIEKFSLCLIEDWENAYHTISLADKDSGYSEYMTAPLIWNKGEKMTLDRFPSKQLHPVPFETGGNISYFLPLHFDERYLGYFIITNNDFPIFSILCHTMSMSIGNAIEGISKLNVQDPLCKIYNRNGFIRTSDILFKNCVASGNTLMISFVDMDGLKYINDNYGHKEGDYAIQQTANAISSCCREGSDICARFGGDEFVVMCVNIPESFDKQFENRFENKMKAINDNSTKPYTISASIGSIIVSPSEKDRLSDIIQKADALMYEVKKKKKQAKAEG
ncbi:MAG: GGDEF domain-containing protein [Lachnospiraceae bacterium]|nr:GGDEF domain-containing protein [Lachnospiraceae bacterium]